MPDLLTQIEKGLSGENYGRTTGSISIDKMTLGISKGMNGLIVAKEKVGKSKWARYHYIVQPYLLGTLKGQKYRWVLFTLEEPRYMVEADVCSALIYELYGQTISRNLMLSRQRNAEGEVQFMTDEQYKLVVDTYEKHIVPLFGRYSKDNTQIQKGLIETYETEVTPKEYEEILIKFASLHGDLIYSKVHQKNALGEDLVTKKLTNFVPYDEEIIPIVIVDDYRSFKKVNGDKQTIDDIMAREVQLTQTLNWYFILGVLHLNREYTDFKRIEQIGRANYYPDTSLIKDSGNPGERKHWVMALFNPRDPAFDTPMHMGHKVPKDGSRRSIHLIASRNTVYPQHAICSFNGETITFKSYIDVVI